MNQPQSNQQSNPSYSLAEPHFSLAGLWKDIRQRTIDDMTSRLPVINTQLDVLRKQKETMDALHKRQLKITRMQQILDDEMSEVTDTITRTENQLNLICHHVQPTSQKLITPYGQSWHRRHIMECALCHAVMQVNIKYTGSIESVEPKLPVVYPYNSELPFISVDDLGPEFSGVVDI